MPSAPLRTVTLALASSEAAARDDLGHLLDQHALQGDALAGGGCFGLQPGAPGLGFGDGRIRKASASAGFSTLATSSFSLSSALRTASSRWAWITAAWASACARGPAWPAWAWARSTSAL